MSFTLPDLPYAHDALAPYMSGETLEYHHTTSTTPRMSMRSMPLSKAPNGRE
ncbi:hypothetical protein ACVMDN_008723 [Bradyrhizobium sp. USDA 4510]